MIEVGLGVQFRPQTVDTMRALAFYERVRAEYPQVQEQPARPRFAEDFSRPQQRPPGLRVQIANVPPTPRYLFASEDGTRAVQLQHDVLVINWREREGKEGYPGYQKMRERLSSYLRDLDNVLEAADRPSILPDWCDITYVNRILAPEGSTSRVPLSSVLIGVGPFPPPGSSLPALEDAQIRLRFVIPGKEDPLGRLNIGVMPAFRTADQRPVWVLTNNARIRCVGDKGVDSALDAIDVAHEWATKGFTESTPVEMRERWQQSRA